MQVSRWLLVPALSGVLALVGESHVLGAKAHHNKPVAASSMVKKPVAAKSSAKKPVVAMSSAKKTASVAHSHSMALTPGKQVAASHSHKTAHRHNFAHKHSSSAPIVSTGSEVHTVSA